MTTPSPYKPGSKAHGRWYISSLYSSPTITEISTLRELHERTKHPKAANNPFRINIIPGKRGRVMRRLIRKGYVRVQPGLAPGRLNTHTMARVTARGRRRLKRAKK